MNNQNFGYTDVNRDYYNNETYNYDVPDYAQSQYDYNGQYFVDSEGKENSAYQAVADNEVTKRNDQEYNSNNYSDVSYEELYNSYTQGQDMETGYNNMYSMPNNYDNNNYNVNDYNQSYNYNQNNQIDNKNYYEDNEDLSSLDRYFNDDNY